MNMIIIRKILFLALVTNILIGIPIWNNFGLIEYETIDDFFRLDEVWFWWGTSLVLIIALLIFKDDSNKTTEKIYIKLMKFKFELFRKIFSTSFSSLTASIRKIFLSIMNIKKQKFIYLFIIFFLTAIITYFILNGAPSYNSLSIKGLNNIAEIFTKYKGAFIPAGAILAVYCLMFLIKLLKYLFFWIMKIK